MEEERYYGDKKEKDTSSVIKLVLKILFTALVVFLYGFLILRMCTMDPSEDTRSLVWDKTLLEAYHADPEGFTVSTQSLHQNMDENGYIAFFDVLYIPSAKQLQLTVRYNVSTVAAIEDAYSLSEITGEPLVFSLRAEDGTRYSAYSYTATKTNRYYFRHLVFNDVDLDVFTILPEDKAGDGSFTFPEGDGYVRVYETDYLYLDAFYPGDIDPEHPLASVTAFNRALSLQPYDFKKTMPKDDAPNASLQPSPYFIISET